MAEDTETGERVRAFAPEADRLTLETRRGETIALPWRDVASVEIQRRQTPAVVLLLLGALIGGMTVLLASGAGGPRLLLNATLGLLFFPLVLGHTLSVLAGVHLGLEIPIFIVVGPLYGLLAAFLFALVWDTVRFVARPFVLGVVTASGRRFVLADGGRERVEAAARRLARGRHIEGLGATTASAV